MTIIEIATVINENPKVSRSIVRKSWHDRVVQWRPLGTSDVFMFMNVDNMDDDVVEAWIPYLSELLADDWKFVSQ